MCPSDRELGGKSNKKGNRYEDAFAVCRLIELYPRVMKDGVSVLIKEQAGCHVDDLLICEAELWHYYQLKDDQTITWGREEGKLRKEFENQKNDCDRRGEKYSLTVVVSEHHRRQSLEANLPTGLFGAVAVRHFQRVRRPSELSRRPDLQPFLRQMTARQQPGPTDLEEIVIGFHAAWVECALDSDEYGNLKEMIKWLHSKPFRIRRPQKVLDHITWDQCRSILNRIQGLEWYIDRGYFEWFRRPSESGLLVRCDEPAFQWFVDRVIAKTPTTFEELEDLFLP